jgi:hypothetical protein
MNQIHTLKDYIQNLSYLDPLDREAMTNILNDLEDEILLLLQTYANLQKQKRNSTNL